MTTLYRPVLIESAEQAEALPIGTLAREGANVIIKSFDGRWWWAGLDGVVQPQSEAAVGWTALVPIEAEETKVRGFATLDDQSITVTVKTSLPPEKIRIWDGLLVAPGTPWEEA